MHLTCRDEIGTCQNIEVDIEIIGNSQFVIRPFNVKQEGKPFMHRETKE